MLNGIASIIVIVAVGGLAFVWLAAFLFFMNRGIRSAKARFKLAGLRSEWFNELFGLGAYRAAWALLAIYVAAKSFLCGVANAPIAMIHAARWVTNALSRRRF
jgi:hypothetical protein